MQISLLITLISICTPKKKINFIRTNKYKSTIGNNHLFVSKIHLNIKENQSSKRIKLQIHCQIVDKRSSIIFL